MLDMVQCQSKKIFIDVNGLAHNSIFVLLKSEAFDWRIETLILFRLPAALVTLKIIDALIPNSVKMYDKWNLICKVKHFCKS